jgi:hypothetical protein
VWFLLFSSHNVVINGCDGEFFRINNNGCFSSMVEAETVESDEEEVW